MKHAFEYFPVLPTRVMHVIIPQGDDFVRELAEIERAKAWSYRQYIEPKLIGGDVYDPPEQH